MRRNEYLQYALKRIERIGIIGGGLAGLTAALHLSKAGFEVLLFEKERYPKHKVCGEYISNEILPYWTTLGVNPFEWGAVPITNFEFTTVQGEPIEAELPLGGFSISRYLLDFNLMAAAKKAGVRIVQEQVQSVEKNNEIFSLQTLLGNEYEVNLVIGSYGKRSNLDKALHRKFITLKTPWLAVKGHYSGSVNSNTVSLHNFDGGYCGISSVEKNRINVCYITHLDAFKERSNLENFQEDVLERNPKLKAFFKEATPLFEKPLTISQISFDQKKVVENHIFMCGDSAGLIHPLCGNGMAMAVRGAQLLSEHIIKFDTGNWSRSQLERNYEKSWKKEFNSRLRIGSALQTLFQNRLATRYSFKLMQNFPFLLKYIIKATHGKPVKN